MAKNHGVQYSPGVVWRTHQGWVHLYDYGMGGQDALATWLLFCYQSIFWDNDIRLCIHSMLYMQPTQKHIKLT